MSTSCELLAIGPYTPELADKMEYPAEYYGNVAAGTPITTVVGYVSGAISVRHLAEALGLEMKDFSRTLIDPMDVNIGLVNELGREDDGQDDLGDRLQAFLDAGFQVFFRIDT